MGKSGWMRIRRTPAIMEVHLAPKLQAEIDQLLKESGYPLEDLVADALAGYVPDLPAKRGMLDSRYDDLKNGNVKPIDGEEFFANAKRVC
jgi:hypothetical protein